jgi:hypothetical protein
MSFLGIKASLSAGTILGEESFEVKADTVCDLLPRSKRINRSSKLFDGLYFILDKNDIAPSIYDDLKELILIEGGYVYRVVDEADLDSVDASQVMLVKSVEDSEKRLDPFESQFKIVSPSWIFDCISKMN